MPKGEKLNDGHIAEAADRVHVIACMVDDFLLQHPLIAQSGWMKKRVLKISDDLGGLYQFIGKIEKV